MPDIEKDAIKALEAPLFQGVEADEDSTQCTTQYR